MGLFGHLGAGNIGNDASLEAMLEYLNTDQPDAILDAMCTGPEVLADRYGVPANEGDRSRPDEIRASYVGKMKSFTRWLIDNGRRVRLFVGDTNNSDETVVEEIVADLRAHRADLDSTWVVAEPIVTFADLMRAMEPAGTVIATRYHNVVCALMLSKPTISIGYGEKNGAGGHVDQVAADGGAAGLGVGEAGQGPGGAQQVVRDDGAGQPGRVDREDPDIWQVRQRPVGPVGEDLFHDRVVAVAVLAFALDQLERGTGEHDVVPPGGEHSSCPAAASPLRALGAARRSVRTSMTRSVVLVVFGLAGAFVGGAAGSVWGALVANLIAIGVAWHQLQAAQRGHVLAASD